MKYAPVAQLDRAFAFSMRLKFLQAEGAVKSCSRIEPRSSEGILRG